MGYVQIRVPAGVAVECQGHAFGGLFTSKGAGARESERVVRVVGRASLGFVECVVASDSASRLPRPD